MQFTTKFVIEELDNGWEWPDIHDEEDGWCFCAEELEIPQEYLKTITLYSNKMSVHLHKDREYVRDDWYVNLSRISA